MTDAPKSIEEVEQRAAALLGGGTVRLSLDRKHDTYTEEELQEIMDTIIDIGTKVKRYDAIPESYKQKAVIHRMKQQLREICNLSRFDSSDSVKGLQDKLRKIFLGSDMIFDTNIDEDIEVAEKMMKDDGIGRLADMPLTDGTKVKLLQPAKEVEYTVKIDAYDRHFVNTASKGAVVSGSGADVNEWKLA